MSNLSDCPNLTYADTNNFDAERHLKDKIWSTERQKKLGIVSVICYTNYRYGYQKQKLW